MDFYAFPTSADGAQSKKSKLKFMDDMQQDRQNLVIPLENDETL
jgi:hypothetical protein